MKTMEDYAKVFNYVCDWSFENRSYNKMVVHHNTYYKCRSLIPRLPATLVESAKDVACEAMKRLDLRIKPRRKKKAAIRYSVRGAKAYLDSGFLSIASNDGRIHAPFHLPENFNKYRDGEVRGGVLWYNKTKDCFFFGIMVYLPKPEMVREGDVLGVDRGLKYAAVTSKNQFFISNHIRNIKGKYAHLRAQLQAKGTRSAKRKLRRISGRERRFIACQNHSIAKQIVNSCQRAIAIEDLSGINTNRSVNKWFERRLPIGAFINLSSLSDTRPKNKESMWLGVNPEYTSQKCSRCGHIDSKNRVKGNFHCRKCSM